jgi:hypothetical protein
MITANNGGPAFPSHEAGFDDPRNRISGGGMSLRDYFAAKAMQSLTGTEWRDAGECKRIAECAYKMADAMLAQRDAA